MKRNLKHVLYRFNIILLFSILCFACEEENDIPPGLSVQSLEIKSFPGDEVTLKGMASAINGMEKIEISCSALEVYNVIDLTREYPKVFNFNYSFSMPETMSEDFDDVLNIIVYDIDGNVSTKEIPVTFLPDTTEPWFVSIPPNPVAVDFDIVGEKAGYTLNIEVEDDRNLSTLLVSIPDIGYEEEILLEGVSQSVTRSVTFLSTGTFSGTIKVVDKAGNFSESNMSMVVMPKEEEDPIQDYGQMYVFNADENADDYLTGYYRYMDRQGDYQYEGKFYAPVENTSIYFAPTKSQDGDLFGTSPYVSSKLMNKNGYVVPVVLPEAGYYGIWLDLSTNTYSVWKLEVPEGTYNGDLGVSGTGFTIGDWALPADNMSKVGNGYQYEYEMELVADYSGKIQYYFYSPDWAHIYRADVDGNWWFESAEGGVIAFDTDYSGKVKITFDTAYPWSTMKKVIQ